MYITIIFFIFALYYIFCADITRGFATADNGIEDTNNVDMYISNTSNQIESQFIGEEFTPSQIIDLTFAADTSY